MTWQPRSKYRNTRATVDGITFDSRAEAARWQHLLAEQQAGRIADLVRQVSFELAPAVVIQGKRKRALTYRADFTYTDAKTGAWIVEDVKGMLTDVYKIKRHLMMHVHGIEILETTGSGSARKTRAKKSPR